MFRRAGQAGCRSWLWLRSLGRGPYVRLHLQGRATRGSQASVSELADDEALVYTPGTSRNLRTKNLTMQRRKIKPRNTSPGVAKVVDLLREKIASNELRQGTKLREIEFAETLGASRQAVREAFTVLEQKGLVSRIPNRGAYVASYDYQEMMDLYDIRESLTILTYQLAARRAPEGAWAEISDLFGEPLEEAVRAKDVKAFSDAIVELDRLASDFANNKFLEPILSPLIDLTQVLARRAMLLPHRLEIGLNHNRLIIQALASRDEDAVAEIFGEMMKVSRDYLTKYKEVLF